MIQPHHYNTSVAPTTPRPSKENWMDSTWGVAEGRGRLTPTTPTVSWSGERLADRSFSSRTRRGVQDRTLSLRISASPNWEFCRPTSDCDELTPLRRYTLGVPGAYTLPVSLRISYRI